MATVNVSSNGILSPYSFDSWFFGGILSTTDQSVTLVDAARSTAWKSVYSGSFTTTISGEITGTVTGFAFVYNTTAILTVTGLSLDAATLLSVVGNHDTAGLTAMLFAGDDVFNAQAYRSYYGPGHIFNAYGGNDLIHASQGMDHLTAGLGNDTVYAGLAQDTVLGGGGNDKLYGDGGNDLLQGGTGRDLLSGGWDADTLMGGMGADQLYGGLGADVFMWASLADSRVARVYRDTVQDFSATSGDRIDLSAMDAKAGVKGNQAFVLVEGLTGLAGSLFVQSTAQGCVIFADTNGDAVADFAIDIVGSVTLSAADFIL